MSFLGDGFAAAYHLFLKCLAELHAVKTVHAGRNRAGEWAARAAEMHTASTSR